MITDFLAFSYMHPQCQTCITLPTVSQLFYPCPFVSHGLALGVLCFSCLEYLSFFLSLVNSFSIISLNYYLSGSLSTRPDCFFWDPRALYILCTVLFSSRPLINVSCLLLRRSLVCANFSLCPWTNNLISLIIISLLLKYGCNSLSMLEQVNELVPGTYFKRA